jgi:mRNA-degrading endonuclease RelE of RelBE toxin-antitoxin system
MRVIYSANFARQFDAVPAEVQRAFRKQVSLLVEKLCHPSLRAKARDIWQARVTGSWRFYFRIEDDAYQVLTIHSHPK